VPDEQVKPDIRNAPRLKTPERLIPELKGMYKDDIASYEESVQTHVRTGTFLKGITAQERLLVAKRYKYARDVKLLALQAELAEVGDKKQDFTTEVELPSGVKLGLDQSFVEARPELLNPAFWERRTQFKDRVYKIQVAGKNYLLKERKTNRHTDTKERGHKDGLPTYDEFKLAQYFKDHGRVEKDRVVVDWERPVGYAVYPDGFSFTVFEYEEGLEGEDFSEHLVREIVAHKEEFKAEYELIAELAEKYKDSPEVNRLHGEISESNLVSLLKWLKVKGAAPALSFEEFARSKAYRMEQQARRLQREAINRAGYENSDGDGFAYKVLTDKKLRLQIFGFDFEYFSPISPERTQRLLEVEKEMDQESLQGIRFMMWSNRGGEVTRLQRAAYQAMVTLEFGTDAINEEG
jgi:hypothetical protein